MPAVALVPIRGITLADKEAENYLGPTWSLLSVQQARNLVAGYDATGSLPGNFNMIEARLAPDAYLLVRCEVPNSPGYLVAYDYAETILAALCIAVLLAPDLWSDLWRQWPTPLYRARFKEACDLPLVFDEARVRVVGHSSSFAWLSPSDHMLPLISKRRVHEATLQAPNVVDRILRGEDLSDADRLLRASLRAMHAGLQATTPGQLTANLVSATELLVSAQDREPWFRRKARLKVLIGGECWSRCEDILEARHAFVHESTQPVESFLGHSALAMFVQAWVIFAQLLSRLGEQRQVLDVLDQLVRTAHPGDRQTHELTADELAALNALHFDVPSRPVECVKWVHQYLIDVHPADYHKRFVVGGKISCAGDRCGQMLSPQHLIGRESDLQVFRCHMCGFISRASLVSPEISQVLN